MTLERCPWYVAGPLMGLLIVGLRAAVNKPFGALGGYIDIAENGLTPARLGFRAYLVAGLLLGGALYAATLGSFVGSLGYASVGGAIPNALPAQVVVLAAAGVVMGFGARTAGGCTSGHGMSGMSLGSPAAIVSTMTFFGAAVALANGVAWFGAAR